MSRAAALVLGLILGACGDQPQRGGAGESCTRRDDCKAGLRCLSQVCVDTGDAGDGPAAAPAPGDGQACGARGQCAVGLLCVDQTCAEAPAGTKPGGRLSGVGESCRATADCATDLACTGAVCARVTIALPTTDKQCHRVECASDESCCESFVPDENCDAYEENCDVDPVFCNTYRSLCECSLRWEDELCVATAPGCQGSSECTSQQTPFCVEGSCRQCERDANCPGDGTQCVAGVCMAGCALDEQCPALHDCQEGECVEVGCRSDRECVFQTGDGASTCDQGACRTPCARDVDCGGGADRFQVCSQGQCVFIGCESDSECRALLMLNAQPGRAYAVCR
jgi:hypothetical protein